MREILFRGKHTETNEWWEGDLFHTGKRVFIRRPDSPTTYEHYSVIPETVGQYTGLTDKNGKRIFEGDIIKSIYHLKQTNGVLEREIRSSIEYGVGYAYSEVYGVCERFRDGSGVALLSLIRGTKIADCEIIGNIHDNPELLKGERHAIHRCGCADRDVQATD